MTLSVQAFAEVVPFPPTFHTQDIKVEGATMHVRGTSSPATRPKSMKAPASITPGFMPALAPCTRRSRSSAAFVRTPSTTLRSCRNT
ncbi:hypothetical protein EMIT0232MI5_10110 [Pseudomonas sp. IT-232MI5]